LVNPYNNQFKLVGTCQRTSRNSPETSYPEIANIINNVPYFETTQDALYKLKDNNKPDAVIINTPNTLHFENAMQALTAGCHVYIERPIVTHKDDLITLLETAHRNNVLVFTGVQRRLEEPFRYIHDAVTKRSEFGKLKSIRCTISAGVTLRGWRTEATLAGGGILLDSGYHLLDQAIWILQDSHANISHIEQSIVHLSDFTPNNLGVEQTAVGVTYIDGIQLIFDFTYKAPNNSIFERLDVRDQEGSQISLMRNLAQRSPQPGVIRHMRGDGSVATANLTCASRIVRVRAQDVSLEGEAMNTGPLLAFLSAIKSGQTNHVCEGSASISTWQLIRDLYASAQSIINQ